MQNNGRGIWQKARFYGSVCALYAPTLFFAVYLINPFAFSHTKQLPPVIVSNLIPTTFGSTHKKVLSGQPVRITIKQSSNGLAIDLPVDTGVYDVGKNTWTLNDSRAEYANVSVLPNSAQGTTLIYGHNSPQVFGYLNAIHADTAAYATVYTTNKHIFTYAYYKTNAVRPNDTSVFQTTGAPTLVVQTCSGSFFQYRQMFIFELKKIDGHVV